MVFTLHKFQILSKKKVLLMLIIEPLTQRSTETINIKHVGHSYGQEVRKHTVLGPRYMLSDRYLHQV